MKDKHAQATGRKAKGIPKNYTPEEITARTARLALARAKRWPKRTARTEAASQKIVAAYADMIRKRKFTMKNAAKATGKGAKP